VFFNRIKRRVPGIPKFHLSSDKWREERSGLSTLDPMILQVTNLVKKYGGMVAVDGVSFSIEQGKCFGLLGPNGAGKTTIIEVIEGVRNPDSGEILYRGKSRDAAFKEDVGIQFQQTALLAFLSVRETLKTFQSLYQKTANLDDVIRECNLADIQKQRNDKLSGGQRQRLLLALALINNPSLIFLDEPSTGLDPQARRNLWDLIENIKVSGKTIILTTHYMEEAQLLCDVVAIMDHGKIIAQDSPKHLIAKHCEGVTVVLPKPQTHFPTPSVSLPFIETPDRFEIETRDIDRCMKALMAAGVNLHDMKVRSPNLEDVFLRLTGRQLRT
jgi:ABC-2 type transport system ATP-binding protein